MAGLPTIPDIYRCALEFTGGGYRAVNVFHVRCTTSPTVTAIGAKIGASYPTGSVKPYQDITNQVSTSTVNITPLDGVTAGTDQPLGITISGAGTTQPIPAAAVVVSFKTGVRGPKGRGRLYLGPCDEGAQNGGSLTSPADALSLATVWAQWFNAMKTGTGPLLTPVIASYVHSVANDIVSIAVDYALGTQRRRQDFVAGR